MKEIETAEFDNKLPVVEDLFEKEDRETISSLRSECIISPIDTEWKQIVTPSGEIYYEKGEWDHAKYRLVHISIWDTMDQKEKSL